MNGCRCSCGFATGDPDDYADHLGLAFTPDDDIGADGCVHAELADDYVRSTGMFPDSCTLPRHVCACGFATDDGPVFDSHLLLMFITPDGVGVDGSRHVAVNPSLSGAYPETADYRHA